MARLRIDWQKIRDTIAAEDRVYLMDARAASVIVSAFHILGWQSTYRTEDYDYDDWDDLQDILATAEQTLGTGMSLATIIDLIDEVEDLLRELRDQAGCCPDAYDETGGQFATDPVTDGQGDVPQNVIDAGYAADSNDWAGFDDYKCMIAHITVQSMVGKLNALAPYVDNAGNIVAGIGAILALVAGIFTAGSVWLFVGILTSAAGVAALYKALVSGSFLETLADEVLAVEDDLACAIYGSDGSDDAEGLLNAKIDELFTADKALVLKNLNNGPTIKALYAGRYNEIDTAQQLADQGYDVGDFDCTCEAEFDIYFDRGLVAPLYVTPPLVGHGNTSAGADAPCNDSKTVEFAPHSGGTDWVHTEIRYLAQIGGGYPANNPVAFARLTKVVVNYTCPTNWVNYNGSGYVRIRYKDGTYDDFPLEQAVGPHETTIYPNLAKEAEGNWLDTPDAYCWAMYMTNPNGGGPTAQPCLTRLQIWLQYTSGA